MNDITTGAEGVAAINQDLRIRPVLLSGGAGTRLWPLSRKHYPKQLLALLSDRSMLQETALRARGLRDQLEPRSDERREGPECVRPWRYRWAADHSTKKNNNKSG